VRILVARCEIAYHGRAVTRLGAGDRVILFKTDGSLCVHADKGYKPLKGDFITLLPKSRPGVVRVETRVGVDQLRERTKVSERRPPAASAR
jgi:hypothetical protein